MKFLGMQSDGAGVDPVEVEYAEQLFEKHKDKLLSVALRSRHDCEEEGLTEEQTVEVMIQMAFMSGFCTGRLKIINQRENEEN